MSLGMDIGEVSRLFFDFEAEHDRELKEIRYRGFMAWALVKSPLYFSLLHPRGGSDETVSNHNQKKSFNFFNKVVLQFKKGNDLFSLISQLTRIKFRKQLKEKRVLFYTFTGDKLTRDKSGNYFNFLTDEFIVEKLVTNYVYAERSFNSDFKLPSRVHIDLKLDCLDSVSSLYRFKNKNTGELNISAQRIFTLFNSYLVNKGKDGLFTINVIKEILLAFSGEFDSNLFLLKIIKPDFIITSEMLGSGLIAAANTLKISSIDLQHGIIDRYHAQYVYNSSLNLFKPFMCLPKYMGVYGELHKEILLKEGFWEASEIKVLGSGRVESNRKGNVANYNNPSVKAKIILIPTQWTFFNDTKELLELLIENLDSNFRIILKIHPHEPESNILFYVGMQNAYPLLIKVSDKNDDIYKDIADADLVIGFNSAVLLETVSLMKPCISITTSTSPNGIHQLYGNERLERAIKKVNVKDKSSILALIRSVEIKDEAYFNWLEHAKEESYFLYAAGYIKNCERLINEVFSTN